MSDPPIGDSGSGAEIRPAGDRALLITPAQHDQLGALVTQLRRADLVGVEDLLPAADTVLLTLTPQVDRARLHRDLRDVLARTARAEPAPAAQQDEVRIRVRYDGEDLAEVADLLGVDPEEVIQRHVGATWVCRFIGFTAGFGYLESPERRLRVPRRRQSRTAVPAGAVALADGYSAVYPRSTPGGWQVIGRTETRVWDLSAPRPALLAAGTRVRFVREDE